MLKRFLKDERGEDLIEYGLLAGLIAIALILVLGDVGSALIDVFQAIVDALTGLLPL
jgi:pilus assembly protein Flp/PilA